MSFILDTLKTTQGKVTVGVLLVVTLISILSKWANNVEKTPLHTKSFSRLIKRLVQQSSKAHRTSQQDADPLLSLVHANYALVYASVARAIADDSTMEAATGLKPMDMIYSLENDQKRAIDQLVGMCPELKPPGVYAIGHAWM